MKLPHLNQAERYRGLYAFDFGAWTAVGYTAEEIAVLLESEQYGTGKVYKIVRATPDGQMELRGVQPGRWHVESGMFFNRADLDSAEADFGELCELAAARSLPCRAFVHLADRGPAAGPTRYVTALIYPAEDEDELARWLLDANYQGGDTAEGGISHATNYHAEPKTILRRQQLWSQSAISSRSSAEVLRSVRTAVQR